MTQAGSAIDIIYTQSFHTAVILALYTWQQVKERVMKKSVMAVLVAFLITSCVGAAIFAVGGAALFNKHGTVTANSPSQQTTTSISNPVSQTSQTAQLEGLIAQYQDREKQYQQREQQLQSDLAQANSQIQSDQQIIQQTRMLLAALQQRGIIRVTEDGRIFINQ
jgi:predicted PurR-regulated permease PerM